MRIFRVLTTVAVVGSGALLTSAWATPEEIAAAREQERLERSERIGSVRQMLRSSYDDIRDRTIYYDGPDTGAQAAYQYIRELGGSVVDRRSAFFELEVSIETTDRGSDYCYGVVTARLIDHDPAGADWEVIAQGAINTGWPGRCSQPPNQLVHDVLGSMS